MGGTGGGGSPSNPGHVGTDKDEHAMLRSLDRILGLLPRLVGSRGSP